MTGELVQCSRGAAASQQYMQLEEEHDGRYQMRDSRCVRRRAAALLHRRESPSCS